VAVEILACLVVARVGVAGGDLDVSEVNSCVEHRGDEGMPQHVRVGAADAYSADAGEMPEAAGGSGIRTILVPLPHTRSTRWPCSSSRSAMLALVASKPQCEQSEHGDECEVARVGRLAAGGEHRFELQVGESQGR
jgi:hypothetical protein